MTRYTRYSDIRELLIRGGEITSTDVLSAFKLAIKEHADEAYIDNRLIPYLDKLQIESNAAIGTGGYGTVFNVSGAGTISKNNLGSSEIPLVIKIIDMQGRICAMSSDMDFHSQATFFKNEIAAMRKCSECKNTMPIYGSLTIIGHDENFNSTGVFALLMPRLTPLQDWLRLNASTIDESDILRLTIDMAKALDACRINGILHKDIKIGNMFYSAITDDFVLGDFGVSTDFSNNKMEHYNPTYQDMAPYEYQDAKYTHCTDIYWLGKIVKDILPKHFSKEIEYSYELKCILKEMTQYFPSKRVQSIREVITYLDKNLEFTVKVSTDDSKSERLKINTIIQNCITAVKNKADGVSYEKLKKALDIIEEGVKIGNDSEEGIKKHSYSCIRIKAYLLYCIGLNDNEYLHQAFETLQALVYFDQDPLAIFLNALIKYDTTSDQFNTGDFWEVAKPLADSGYSLAQFYCSQMLFNEGRFVTKDVDTALKYLIKAIDNGFDAAIVYLHELIENQPELVRINPDVAKYAYTEFVEVKNYFPLSVMRVL